MSFFIYSNPPNTLQSKKVITRQWDIPTMSMNTHINIYA